jgi:hypothetical protein
MIDEILPFNLVIDTTAIAGSALWSLALYWGLSPLTEWLIEQLARWLNYADRFLYTSQEEFEKSIKVRESQNSFYAAILSIIPFLLIGCLCNWGVKLGLGNNWSISVGLIACIGGAVYELGRRSDQ